MTNKTLQALSSSSLDSLIQTVNQILPELAGEDKIEWSILNIAAQREKLRREKETFKAYGHLPLKDRK